MREIKFRGKRIDNEEWVYGYMFYDYNGCDEYVPFIVWKDDSYVSGCGEEAVYKDTIGQFTGLKDKNGKEIYEGDIVQILGGEYEQGFYEWDERVQIKDLIYDGFNLMMTISQIGKESVEVIGNIYDNPELLKEE